MLFRYVAWLWDAADEGGALEAAELARRFRGRESWSRAFARPGIEVHVTGCSPRVNEVYTLADSGVILGKLFTRAEGGSREVPVGIPENDARTILTDEGRSIISHYWGRYVAFLCVPNERTIRVIRAPCGSLPCLGVRLGRLQVYCSWIEDLSLAGMCRWSIDWAVVCALLCGALPDFRQTALQGITQLLGGECATHTTSHTERGFYWDPVRTSEVSTDLNGAQHLLRSCVIDCVRAWRACHEKIAQTLSGGIDSSIVASAQGRAAIQSTVFLNYYLDETETDEREFARLVANHLGGELVEWLHDPCLSLKGLLQMRRLPLPPLCLHSLEYSQREVEFCARRGITGLFGGHGGDQAFYSGPGAPCAANRLTRRPWSPRAWRTVVDAAHRDRQSVWHVLREIREQRKRPLGHLLGMRLGKYRPLTLLEPEIVEHIQRAQPEWMHPLLRDPAGADPARMIHAEHVLTADDYYDHFCGPNYPDRVSPILSQPVVELCLGLPRHLLISGGWTRAVARRAFQSDLPFEVVTRRDKGTVTDHFRSILRCNMSFVRELLLDGELVKHHILNREKTERVLSGDPTRMQTSPEELAIYLCATGWLRQFEPHVS